MFAALLNLIAQVCGLIISNLKTRTFLNKSALIPFSGHHHEELESLETRKDNLKYYPGERERDERDVVSCLSSGYPGVPEILPSHQLIEQSPGYGHPYLPSDHTDIEVDHFLWTGDIAEDEAEEGQQAEAEQGFSVGQKIYPGYPVSPSPSSVLVTRSVTLSRSLVSCIFQGWDRVHHCHPANSCLFSLWKIHHCRPGGWRGQWVPPCNVSNLRPSGESQSAPSLL